MLRVLLLLAPYFADELPLPDATVPALVAKLGDDDFETRQKAFEALQAKGPRVLKQLEAQYAAHADAEVRRRLSDLVGAAVNARLEPFRPIPSLDALWYDVAARRYRSPGSFDTPWHMAEAHLRLSHYLDRVGRDHYPWYNYRLATRVWLEELLDAGVPARLLVPLVDLMRERDEVFYAKYERDLGKPPHEPWQAP